MGWDDAARKVSSKKESGWDKAARGKSGKGSGGKDGKRSILGGVVHGGGSVLTGALNVLDRPVQATKSLVRDARTDAGTGETIKHLGAALSGKQHISTQEALGTHVKGVGGALLNFTGDVALDPTTYLSLGTSAAAKAGLKTATKELGETVAKDIAKSGVKKALTAEQKDRLARRLVADRGEKAGAKVMKKLERGGQGGVKLAGHTVVSGERLKPVTEPVAKLGRKVVENPVIEAYIPRGGIARTAGKETAEDIGAAESRARAVANNASHETVGRIAKVFKAAGVHESEKPLILSALEANGRIDSLPQHLRPVAQELRKIAVETTDIQNAAEVLGNARPDYVPRFLTQEAEKLIGQDAPRYGLGSAPASVAKQGGHLKGRTFMPDATLTDANKGLTERLRTMGLKGDAYETDPAVITARRAALAHRAVAQKGLFDEVAAMKGGSLLRKAEPGSHVPLGWAEFDAGPLGHFHAPKEVAKEMEHVRSVITNDDALREFKGLIGHLSTLWKGYATVPIVGGFGFHQRNAQGNIWNNFLAGVKNPKDYAWAAKVQAGRGLSAADKAELELAKAHGVIDEGFNITDLARRANEGDLARSVKGGPLPRPLKGGTLNPLSTENAVIRSGRKVGGAVENNARLAHFHAKLRELGDADEAARSVKKYLFDYADLTEKERGAKKVFAFWTFMRKNTPLQVREMFAQPGKFTGMAHTYNEALQASPDGDYPDWAVKSGMVPVGDGRYMLGLDSPVKSAVEMFDPAQQSELGLLSGLLPSLGKAGVEDLLGKSFYTKKPIYGSRLERFSHAAFPLLGKVKRAPYGHRLPSGLGVGLNADPEDQEKARLINALLGILARNTENDR